MKLFHFDAYQDDHAPFATARASLPDRDAARGYAARLAVSLANKPTTLDRGEAVIVVQAYTAEDGVVLTVRLVLGIELT